MFNFLLFGQLDFTQLQISQCVASEEGYGNLYNSLVGIDPNDLSDKPFQMAMGYLDTVSDRKIDLNGFQFYAKRFDFLFGQWNRFGCRTDETGDAANIANKIPGFRGDQHLDQNVAGKYFSLHLTLFAVIIVLFNRFGGYSYLKNPVAESLVLDALFYILCNFVLIPGIRVNNIPSGCFLHHQTSDRNTGLPVNYARPLSESQDQSAYKREDPVDDPDKPADCDHNHADDAGIVNNLLFGRPDDFFDLAAKLFGESG